MTNQQSNGNGILANDKETEMSHDKRETTVTPSMDVNDKEDPWILPVETECSQPWSGTSDRPTFDIDITWPYY